MKNFKRLTLLCGHYGSGKTNVAVNLAFYLKEQYNNVVVADLDIVNPYFCSREQALPLANAVLGETGVFYCSGAVIVFNTLCFTHGIWLMNKGNKVKFSVKSVFLNPGVISVAIGLPLFLFSVELPDVVRQPIELISNMNTPLAMLIFGTYLANTDLKTMFKIKEQYLIMLVRLIAVPLVVFGFCRLMNFPALLTTACIISASAPSAANTVMFAAKYDKDTAVASKVVALVSFASIITLPMMIALTKS